MRFRFVQIPFIILCALLSTAAMGQADTSFWFAAPDLERAHADGNIFLRIASGQSPAEVTISQPANPGFQPITIALGANAVQSYNLTPFLAQLENDVANAILNKGLLIQSTSRVSCYYDIANTANGDMFVLKGANALGLKFTIPFNMTLNNWRNRTSNGVPVTYHNDFIIVATENNTELSITPDKSLVGIAFGTTQRVTLQRGQTYVCRGLTEQGNTKPGGTIVTATKPVAVTIKDDSIELPGLSCGDTAGDQLIPDRLAGTDFIILKGYLYNPGNNPFAPPAPGSERPDHYFVFAIENGTSIKTSEGNTATLNAGEYYAGTLSIETCYITADKPVHVFQVTGFGCELSGAVIPSLKCTGSADVSVIRATQGTNSNEQFYINILSPADIISQFTFNGSNAPVSADKFLPVPGSQGKWMYTKITVPATVVPTGSSATIKNGSGKFHVGVIQGGPLSTARYGYFSDFSSNTVLIRDPQNPANPLGDELVICYRGNLSMEAVNTEKDLTFLWTGPNGFSSTAPMLQFNNFQLQDTGKYQITTTSAGCNSSGSKTIRLSIDKPIPAFTFTTNGCVEDSVSFASPAAAGTRWVWDFGNGKTLDTTAGITKPVKLTQTGGTPVKLKVYSARGCASDDSTQSVNLSSRPVARLTLPVITCVNDELRFSDASSIVAGQITKWKWNLDNGNGFTEATSNAAQSTRYTQYGKKAIRLLVESATGCMSDTFRVDNFIVNPLPVPGFINPEVCQNDKESLFTDTTRSPDGFRNFSYRWDFNAGPVPVSPAPTVIATSFTAQHPVVQFNQIGSYLIKLVVTSRGCTDSVLQPFKVYGANPIPRFNMTKPADLLCSNDSIFVENQSTIDFDNVAKLIIKWNVSDSLIDENPAIGKRYGFRYADFLSPLETQQTISLRAFSGTDLSCSKLTDSAIIIHASPEVFFDSLPSMCLLDTPRILTQVRANPAVPGNFTFSGKGVSPEGLFKPVLAGPGTFRMVYLYTSNFSGCTDSAARNITVWPMPRADAGADLRIKDDAQQMIQASAGGLNISVLWSPPQYLSRTDTVSPLVINPQQDTEYTLTVTGEGGCITQDKMTVTAINKMMAPNTFTPNGDGVNDYWVIKNATQYPECVVEVYDSRGAKVFQSAGYTQPWDGRYKGKELPVGTYYYTIEPRNGRKRFSGFVTIIK